MKTQNFSNHVRKHPFYHYFLVPVSLLLIAGSIYSAFVHFSFEAILIIVLSVFIHLLVFLVRDYAKKNQDRIIRLELRQRYFQLTGKDFEDTEKSVSLAKILALRFASDKELVHLLDSSELSTQTATQIKQQIKNWKPDTMRV